jgi:hypothetical protein
MEIYGNPRDGAARELCIDFAVAKNTVRRTAALFSDGIFLMESNFDKVSS